jgi:2',3'-cyclic-nucleotide 2'-phosphodiesterase (5'-nucleotidase family)
MHKFIAVWLLLLLSGLVGAQDSEELRLVVLHTNDVHGQCATRQAHWLDKDAPPTIGGLPRVAAYVAGVRAELDGPNEGLLVLDGGDWFQGTPEGLLDDGEAFTRALTAVGYDALVVGNHEFDHGVDHLAQLIEKTQIPCVLANVRKAAGEERVEWAPPYRIFERVGLRIGVVGLLTPETPSITHADARGLYFQSPIDALTEARAELADQALDLVIPLTHLGLRDDRALSVAHPDLPLIIGGHSHTYLRDGEVVGDCLICQVGSKASAVGRVELYFDAETHALVRRSYQVIDLLDDVAGAPNVAVDTAVRAMLDRSEEAMRVSIGTLKAPFLRSHTRLQTSGVGNWLTDRMRERMGAQVAIQNRGGIRADLQAGPVTRRDAFEVLPFGNHLVLLEISGAQLTAVVEQAVGGHAHSGIEFSGMEISVRPLQEGLGEIVAITIGGKPLAPDDRVTLATNNFLAGGGDDYFTNGEPQIVREDPMMLRELFEHSFKRVDLVDPDATNRFRLVDAR